MIITSQKSDSWTRLAAAQIYSSCCWVQLRCVLKINFNFFIQRMLSAKKQNRLLLWKYKACRVSSWDYLQCQITAPQRFGPLTAARWAIIWPCCLLYLPSLFFFLIYFFLSSLPPTSCSIFHLGIPSLKKKSEKKNPSLLESRRCPESWPLPPPPHLG